MTKRDVSGLLRQHGVQPTATRAAVAEYVLATDEHPSAEQVLKRAKVRLPMISKATVYNTLHLFVAKGLLRVLTLAEGNVVYDCNVDRHHHFIDEQTGAIHDVPWAAVHVAKLERLPGYDVRDYMVVMRGRKKAPRSRARHC